jgi:hypothetical protein
VEFVDTRLFGGELDQPVLRTGPVQSLPCDSIVSTRSAAVYHESKRYVSAGTPISSSSSPTIASANSIFVSASSPFSYSRKASG